MLPSVNWKDPRLQPLAYVADKTRLFEVLSVDKVKGIRLLNCLTDEPLTVGPREIIPGWRLVKPAPVDVPDVADAA